MFKFGEYQPGYDPKIHAPYDPARYYGKREYLIYFSFLFKCLTNWHFPFFPADTPFGEVKLKDFGAWFSRRNKSPQSTAQLISRGNFYF